MTGNALLVAYEQCFSEKRHYDTLSWTISAGLVVIMAAVVTGILKLPANDLCSRLLFALFAGGTIFFWCRIYDRNRFWGEVANEKARDIEKELNFDGLGHAYMKANFDGQVTLKNTDYQGANYKDASPKAEKNSTGSMHFSIQRLMGLLFFAILTLAILPTLAFYL